MPTNKTQQTISRPDANHNQITKRTRSISHQKTTRKSSRWWKGRKRELGTVLPHLPPKGGEQPQKIAIAKTHNKTLKGTHSNGNQIHEITRKEGRACRGLWSPYFPPTRGDQKKDPRATSPIESKKNKINHAHPQSTQRAVSKHIKERDAVQVN